MKRARNDGQKRGILIGLILVCLMEPTHDLWAMGRKPSSEMPPSQQSSPLQTLTLEGCYQLALKRSETVAISREEISKVYANFLKATGEALGDVSFLITDTFQEPQKGDTSGGSSVGSTFTKEERRERKWTISQPLFQGFKSVGALTGAGGLREQRKQEHLQAKDELYLDVAYAFYSFLKQKKDVEVIEGIHNLFDERISDLEEREEIGRSRASEVATAKARMKTIEAELAQSKGGFEIAKYLLSYFIGLDKVELRDEDVPKVPDEGVEHFLKAVSGRPDVLAAKQALKTAKRAFIVAQSELWPQISLEHNQYEKREGFQSGIDYDLLLKVDVPVFKGGEALGKVKEARSNWKKAKLNVSLVQKKADLDIKEAYQYWISSLEETKAFHEAMKASEENYRFQQDEYSKNLVSNLDVLTALEGLFETSRAANRANYEMKMNHWKLQIATHESF